MSALEDIRVIDLTQFEAGTSATLALAWLGADVIKVEPVGKGEQGRYASTTQPGLDSHYFMLLNANKRSLTLNLRTEAGKGILRRLIKTGDVFIENFRPGVIERLGFSYEEVAKINPAIVYAQIKGYGLDSPFRDFLAFDAIGQSMGGSLSITGEHDGPPIKPGPTIGDTGAGLHAVIGILAALHQRQRTGRGQRIEVAMQEAVINFCRISYGRLGATGQASERFGNHSQLGSSAPSDIYPCRGEGPNDYVFIYTSRAGNVHWERLLEVIGREDLKGDPRFATPQQREDNKDAIKSVISAWTTQFNKHEVLKRMGGHGVPVGAVLDNKELAEDAYLNQKGMFVTVDHPRRGRFRMPGSPIRMSDSRVPVTPAPLVGAHTEEVLAELLQMPAGEIQRLSREEVL